jgi:diaminopimelate epimerase
VNRTTAELETENLQLRSLLHETHSALLMSGVQPGNPHFARWVADVLTENQKFFDTGEAGKKEKAS